MPSSLHVWYASYGPSMLRERMLPLLLTEPSPARPGVRNRALPLAEVDMELPYDLYLSGHLTGWADMPAFLAPAEEPSGVLARAYLLEASQLFDVLALQSAGPAGVTDDEAAFLLDVVQRDGRVDLGPGLFEVLVSCGSLAGYPVVAFTSSWALSGLAPLPPHPADLAALSSALRSSRGLSEAAVVEYLRSCPTALVV